MGAVGAEEECSDKNASCEADEKSLHDVLPSVRYVDGSQKKMVYTHGAMVSSAYCAN
jgi:hypothetical protein